MRNQKFCPMNNYDNIEEIICLECGEQIPYVRTNKKFCCEKCKNTYHNKIARSHRLSKLRILNALDKNYRILSKLLGIDIHSVDLIQAKQLGFELSYVTSYRKVRTRNEYCCFDIRFKISETKLYDISRITILITK